MLLCCDLKPVKNILKKLYILIIFMVFKFCIHKNQCVVKNWKPTDL